MSDKPKRPRRRWRQFTLRGLFVLVTLVVLLLVGWRTYVEPYREQQRTAAIIEKLGGRYSTEAGGPAWLRSLFGSRHFQDITFVDLADCDQPAEYAERLVRLPRLKTLVVGGRAFRDEHLQQFRKLPAVEALVLDSTSVSKTATAAFAEQFPEVLLHRSQRRAIDAVRKVSGGEGTIAARTIAADARWPSDIGAEHLEVAAGVTFMGPTLTDADLDYVNVLEDLEEVCINTQGPPAQVTDAGMLSISAAKKLTSLSVSGAPRITDASIGHLDGLAGLKSVSFGDCPITDVALGRLADILTLQSLHVSGTKITDDGLAHLSKRRELTELFLSETAVTDQGLVHLKNLPLRLLSLQKTKITDAGLSQIANMTTLEVLFLHGTAISDVGLSKISSLTNLEQLQLVKTNVTDEGLKTLTKLPKLLHLYLSCDRIGARGFAHLRQCPQLTTLYLYGTGLTDAGLAEIARLKELRVLSVQDSPVSNAGVKHLKALRKLERLVLWKTSSGHRDLEDAKAVRKFLDGL
jgi:Leucine-rich repeat (LRR) protein